MLAFLLHVFIHDLGKVNCGLDAHLFFVCTANEFQLITTEMFFKDETEVRYNSWQPYQF